jgi:hypothetical protein
MVRQWWTCRSPTYIMLDVILDFNAIGDGSMHAHTQRET